MNIKDFREKLKSYVELFLKTDDCKKAFVELQLNVKNLFILFIEMPISPIDAYGYAGITFKGLVTGKILCHKCFDPEFYGVEMLHTPWELFTKNLNNILNEFQMFEEFFAELDTKLLEKV